MFEILPLPHPDCKNFSRRKMAQEQARFLTPLFNQFPFQVTDFSSKMVTDYFLLNGWRPWCPSTRGNWSPSRICKKKNVVGGGVAKSFNLKLCRTTEHDTGIHHRSLPPLLPEPRMSDNPPPFLCFFLSFLPPARKGIRYRPVNPWCGRHWEH